MRPWISTLPETPVRTVISPEPVWTSRSTAPVTASVRSKWPSSPASAGLAAIAAASESTSASNTEKLRVRILIFHPPEQIAPNTNEDTQTMSEKFRGGEGKLGRLAGALWRRRGRAWELRQACCRSETAFAVPGGAACVRSLREKTAKGRAVPEISARTVQQVAR